MFICEAILLLQKEKKVVITHGTNLFLKKPTIISFEVILVLLRTPLMAILSYTAPALKLMK
jgi:hypothetical protein